MVQAEQAPNPLRCHGAVESSYQGQPATTRVAERRDFAEGIHGRAVSVREASAGRSQTHYHRSFGDRTHAERSHHVVASAGTDGDGAIEPQVGGCPGTQLTQDAERRNDWWQRASPVALGI